MATQEDTGDEDDTEEKLLETAITRFQSVKKDLFELSRPIDEILERICESEQEAIDRLHRLRDEKHDREKHQQTAQQLIEVESELKTVKRENAKLSDTINKLKQSLEQSAKTSKRHQQKNAELATRLTVTEQELHLAKAAVQARSEVDHNSTVTELQKHLDETCESLSKTTEELSKTRQSLSDVQERLTVAEQVTAATQQRALQESGNSEEQQLELTPRQSTTYTGAVLDNTFMNRKKMFNRNMKQK